MYEENNNGIRNCMDEAIIRMVGKLTISFPDIFEKHLDKQIQLKTVLEESLYGYNIVSESKELILP